MEQQASLTLKTKQRKGPVEQLPPAPPIGQPLRGFGVD